LGPAKNFPKQIGENQELGEDPLPPKSKKMLSDESSFKTIKKIFPRKLQVNVPVFSGQGKGMCKSYTGLMARPWAKVQFYLCFNPLLYDTRSGASPLSAFLSLHFPLDFRSLT